MRQAHAQPPSLVAGADYLLQGLKLLGHPGLRRFVLIPILVNVAIFVTLTTVLLQWFSELLTGFESWLPDWLNFLSWIVLILFGLLLIVVYGFSFSLLTNLLAAPFYGFLAERVARLYGVPLPDEGLLAMTARILWRELRKFWYFLWRGLLVLILSFIPVLGPLLAALWAAWSMAVQYGDYPADNAQWRFDQLRHALRRRWLTSISFGGATLLGSMVPLLNILVLPAAVAGGTLLWIRELQ